MRSAPERPGDSEYWLEATENQASKNVANFLNSESGDNYKTSYSQTHPEHQKRANSARLSGRHREFQAQAGTGTTKEEVGGGESSP